MHLCTRFAIHVSSVLDAAVSEVCYSQFIGYDIVKCYSVIFRLLMYVVQHSILATVCVQPVCDYVPC